jgi:hypothetical protein
MCDGGIKAICLCEFDKRFVSAAPLAALFAVINDDGPAWGNEVVNCF